MAKQDEVRLAVPAMPEFLRLARVTAAGLASRLGFTFDQVEDLRLAIDELCFGLTGANGRAGTVEVRFVLNDGTLEVQGMGHFDEPHGPAGALRALARSSSTPSSTSTPSRPATGARSSGSSNAGSPAG